MSEFTDRLRAPTRAARSGRAGDDLALDAWRWIVRGRSSPAFVGVPSKAPLLETGADEEDRYQLLLSVLENLPESIQCIVEMRTFECASWERIAARLGLPDVDVARLTYDHAMRSIAGQLRGLVE